MNPVSYAFSTRSEPGERRTAAGHARAALKFGLVALLIAAALSLSSIPISAMAADVTDANAAPELPGLGDVIADMTGLSGMLRGGVNMNLANTTEALKNIASNGDLTKKLSEINPAAYTWLKALHKNAAVPLANVVLLTFMVVGLGKVISHAGRTESGVDLWQLVMVFIAYSFAKAIIDASWELMEFAYDIVGQYIKYALDAGAATWNSTPPAAPDSVKNAGALLTMWIITLITWLIATVCGMVANVVVIVRVIQIYVYTALAPVSLGTLVAEGGRQMATGFLKRYAALLLSGLLMAVLFVLFGLMIQSQVLPAVPDKSAAVAAWSAEMFTKIGWAVAFAYCLFKSGAWARDFVGV